MTLVPETSSCIFCKLAQREIPSQPVFEDDQLLAFPDLHPKAPVHLLIIPKKHVLTSVAEMLPEHQILIGRMVWVAKQLAEQRGIATAGYRLVFNTRSHAGQEVDHIHLHLLGGQPLGGMV